MLHVKSDKKRTSKTSRLAVASIISLQHVNFQHEQQLLSGNLLRKTLFNTIMANEGIEWKHFFNLKSRP